MKKVKLLAVGLALVALVGCGSKLTPENLAKVEGGMTQAQVEQILGKPTKVETGGALGISATTMLYESGGKKVKIVIMNDSVMSKSGSF